MGFRFPAGRATTSKTVNASNDIAEFLTSRRAKISTKAGLPRYGQRRVPGLRREEVV